MGVSAEWLAARAAADAGARAATEHTLLPLLIRHLADQARAQGCAEEVQVLDLGAGSGANRRWLAPRLPLPQQWVLLDSDPAILNHLDAGSASAEVRIGGLEALPDWLARTAGQSRLLTCSAVLDVLFIPDLDELCDRLAVSRTPALLSLSVTGELNIRPPDPLDSVLLSAFNEHQRRGGRAGPDAPDLVAIRLREAGMVVAAEPTPWRLAAENVAFVHRFLAERVSAAVEQRPELGDAAARWLARRSREAGQRPFQLTVGHVDLLALPH
jgi:hypothetical protein